MSKATLYSKLKAGWRQWDDDVYQLASLMLSAFSGVIDSVDADASLVAEIKHLRNQAEHYEAWHASDRKAG